MLVALQPCSFAPLALALGALVGGVACAPANERACVVDDDCVSGQCQSTGECAAVPSSLADGDSASDAGDPSATEADPGDGADPTVADADTDGDSDPGDGDPTPTCTVNQDGVITRVELQLAPGLEAKFRIARGATFDPEGTPQGDGTYRWDFTTALAGDATVARGFHEVGPLGLVDPDDTSDPFAAATFATETLGSDALWGVYAATATSLDLLGVASKEAGLFATDLAYDPAVNVLALPLEIGKTWTTEAVVSGLALGVYSYFWEDYASEVDARGVAVTPFAEFPVLRVRTEVHRVVTGLFPVDIVSYAFISECFGTVAWVLLADDEPVDSTAAAEVGRIVP